jgi:penicillin-binding protein 1A
MVGGSDFTTSKFNLATDSLLSPGSAVKPLYYAAAIETGVITPATMIYDSPAVFLSKLNPPYMPRNFLGSWRGPVLARDALANSMNVPSIKVLEAMGFDDGIESIAEFLGKSEAAADRNVFPRSYPIGLGTLGVSPLEMAAAYAVFPRRGRRLEPFAISYIEDRYGEVIYNNERRALQDSAGRSRIITPQAAYLMTDMLTTAVESGTLARRVAEAGGLGEIEMAGKTGTTENWSDAWTVGFSPYMTTAIWFGFMMPGNSLGRYQTGALAAGPVWVAYMKEIHKDLPHMEFGKPESGLISRKVCSVSGMLPTEMCPEVIDEEFIINTEPRELCRYHPKKAKIDAAQLRRLTERYEYSDQRHLEDLFDPVSPVRSEEESEDVEEEPPPEENPLM